VGVQRAQRAVEDLAIDAHHVLASVVARGVRVVGVEQAHQLGAGHSHLPLQAHHPVQKANGEAVLAEVAPVWPHFGPRLVSPLTGSVPKVRAASAVTISHTGGSAAIARISAS
jgi:hypothetical protein